MVFDPKRLPYLVYASYRIGVIAWPLTIQKALNAGITDINTLTDIVFYLHHPERLGKPLGPGDSQLINKWKLYRNMVSGPCEAHRRTLERMRNTHPSSGTMPVD